MNLSCFILRIAVVEQNIYTAQQAESIYGMSRLTGHDATRGFASTGEIQFRWKPGADLGKIAGTGLNIDARAELKCELNNLTYTLLSSNDRYRLEKSSMNMVKCGIIQGKYERQTLTGTGEKLQSFNVQTKKLSDHSKVSVSVNGEKWTKHVSLYDLLNKEKGYLLKTGISGGIDVYFGNDAFGAIPPLGSTIEVEYVNHDGAMGNIDDGRRYYF